MKERLPANTIIPRYRILSRIGAGGKGEVYLAQDAALARKVALKFLSQNSVAGEQARKRFVREARAAAALDHPHICAVCEAGEEAGEYQTGPVTFRRLNRLTAQAPCGSAPPDSEVLIVAC